MPVARQSNIELLRVLSMFFVLLYHSVFLRNGLPGQDAVAASPATAFSDLFCFSASGVCVNVFVLVSGWFGIRPCRQGAAALLFQVLFYFLSGTFVGMLSGSVAAGPAVLFDLFTFSTGYWFVYAYFGLYLLAPVLEAYLSQASRRQVRNVLIGFYLLQTWYGWFRPQEAPFFYGGHSALSFVGLYLVARYCRRYGVHEAVSRPFSAFLLIAVLTAAAVWGLLLAGVPAAYAAMLFQYVSPFMLASSFFLFCTFVRWQLPVLPVVNRLAASAFAVYLVHTHEAFYGYLEHAVLFLRGAHWPYALYLPALLLLLLLVYLLCFAVDQVRLFLWARVAAALHRRQLL